MKRLDTLGSDEVVEDSSRIDKSGGEVAEARILTKRNFLVALGALGFSIGLGSDYENDESEVDAEVRQRDREILGILGGIKTEYRNVKVRNFESVVEDSEAHTGVIYDAATNMYRVASLIQLITDFTGLCINDSHLVMGIKAAQDLLKRYSKLDSSVLRESIRLQQNGRNSVIHYVHTFNNRHEMSANELKSSLENASEFDQFVGELSALMWTISKTKKEREILIGNAQKCGTLAISLAALADALKLLEKALLKARDSLKEAGCDLPSDMFSNSALLNSLVGGNVMAEKRQEMVKVVDLIFEMDPRHENENDVKRVQRFLVDYNYLPDEDPDDPAIDGVYVGKTLQCSYAIQWTLDYCMKLSRHHCVSDRFNTPPNRTLKKFQYVLMSMGYLDAQYEPEGRYDASTNAAFLKLHKTLPKDIPLLDQDLRCE